MSLAILSLLWGSFWNQAPTEPPEVREVVRIEVVKSYIGEVTAYTSREEETDETPFITANGSVVHWGMVATNAYPFGTQLRFPDVYGEKIFEVKDRMHSRYRNRIDIWFPDHGQAKRFGIKATTVEIVQEVRPPELSMR